MITPGLRRRDCCRSEGGDRPRAAQRATRTVHTGQVRELHGSGLPGIGRERLLHGDNEPISVGRRRRYRVHQSERIPEFR